MIIIESGIKHKRVEIPQLTRHNVCNPSVIATESGYECTVRGLNYDLEKSNCEYITYYGSYSVPFPDTQNYYAILDDDLNITYYWFLEDRHLRCSVFSLEGIEDLRLFNWKREKWAIASAINYPSNCANMSLMRVDGRDLKDQVFFSSPTNATKEKNWMPFVHDDTLNFLYTPNGHMLTYENKEMSATHFDRPNVLQNWSGSSCIVERDGKHYAILHKREGNTYTHMLVGYDLTGLLMWQSKEFNFEHIGIEFCAGMAFKGDDVVISYGVMDKKAVLLKMNFDEFVGAIS
jgi:predicted GH43/DUF377 family glycosyl hydrolase